MTVNTEPGVDDWSWLAEATGQAPKKPAPQIAEPVQTPRSKIDELAAGSFVPCNVEAKAVGKVVDPPDESVARQVEHDSRRRMKTADEIVAEQALMPAAPAGEDEFAKFFSAPIELPARTPGPVKIPPKGSSRNPTRDAIEALAREVYELRLLVEAVHARVVAGGR